MTCVWLDSLELRVAPCITALTNTQADKVTDPILAGDLWAHLHLTRDHVHIYMLANQNSRTRPGMGNLKCATIGTPNIF